MSADLAQSFQIDPTELPPEAVVSGGTIGMRKNRRATESLRHTDFPVLIPGKSDPGKEVIRKTSLSQAGHQKRVSSDVTGGIWIREFEWASESPNSNRKMNGSREARKERFIVEVQPFSGWSGGEEYLKLDYFQ